MRTRFSPADSLRFADNANIANIAAIAAIFASALAGIARIPECVAQAEQRR